MNWAVVINIAHNTSSRVALDWTDEAVPPLNKNTQLTTKNIKDSIIFNIDQYLMNSIRTITSNTQSQAAEVSLQPPQICTIDNDKQW